MSTKQIIQDIDIQGFIWNVNMLLNKVMFSISNIFDDNTLQKFANDKSLPKAKVYYLDY
jgi:hypothetical protein